MTCSEVSDQADVEPETQMIDSHAAVSIRYEGIVAFSFFRRLRIVDGVVCFASVTLS